MATCRALRSVYKPFVAAIGFALTRPKLCTREALRTSENFPRPSHLPQLRTLSVLSWQSVWIACAESVEACGYAARCWANSQAIAWNAGASAWPPVTRNIEDLIRSALSDQGLPDTALHVVEILATDIIRANCIGEALHKVTVLVALSSRCFAFASLSFSLLSCIHSRVCFCSHPTSVLAKAGRRWHYMGNTLFTSSPEMPQHWRLNCQEKRRAEDGRSYRWMAFRDWYGWQVGAQRWSEASVVNGREKRLEDILDRSRPCANSDRGMA